MEIECKVPGLIFQIKLLKEVPNKLKASIGPNPQLHHPPAKVLPWYPESVGQLVLNGIKVGLGAFGKKT